MPALLGLQCKCRQKSEQLHIIVLDSKWRGTVTQGFFFSVSTNMRGQIKWEHITTAGKKGSLEAYWEYMPYTLIVIYFLLKSIMCCPQWEDPKKKTDKQIGWIPCNVIQDLRAKSVTKGEKHSALLWDSLGKQERRAVIWQSLHYYTTTVVTFSFRNAFLSRYKGFKSWILIF